MATRKADVPEAPVSTKTGDPVQEQHSPVWIRPGQGAILMSEMSDADLVSAVSTVDQKVGRHREEIASRQHAILTLYGIHEHLRLEIESRGLPNLLIPQIVSHEAEA